MSDKETGDGETLPPQSVDLDTILIEEIGQFGWFQLKTLLLTLVIVIFGAWGGSEYVFTTARVTTRCYIPQCDLEQPEFAADWILSAIPGTSLSSFDNCQRFANASASTDESGDVCPASLFNRTELVDCERLLYENMHSVVYDYDLGCDDWRRSLIGSIRTVGTFVALPITGFVSDHWGRRTALTVNGVNTAWIGALRYFADTYVGFVISQFMEACLGSGVFSSAFILMMEVVGPKYRVPVAAATHSFYSVGQLLTGLIAWGVPDWRPLTLTLYIPQFIIFFYFWIMTESVRWHMSKGRYDKSEDILKHIARVNGKELSQKSLDGLRCSAEQERINEELRKEQGTKEPWLIFIVFKHKAILVRCLVAPIWWITTTFIYYGLSINAVNMSGNSYLNYMAVSAAQIPGYWTAVFLLDRVGRKPVLIGAYWLCAACQIGYIFVPEDQYGWSLFLYLVGTYCSAVVVTAIYVYTTELYPTRYRHRLFGYTSMVGRIGSILAPLSPSLGTEIWEHLPAVLYAGLAALSGALLFITPETLGSKFPDTMEEAADIGKND